jgi:hypothetical protein
MNHRPPRQPFIQPGESVSQWNRTLHTDSVCILRNLYHKFPILYARPTSVTIKERWANAIRCLTYHGYITPTHHLTGKGWQFITANPREFTPHD